MTCFPANRVVYELSYALVAIFCAVTLSNVVFALAGVTYMSGIDMKIIFGVVE